MNPKYELAGDIICLFLVALMIVVSVFFMVQGLFK